MKYTIVTIIIVLSYDNRDKATINFCQYCTYITCNLIMVVNCLYFFIIVVLMTIILYTMIIVNSHLLHHFIPKP